MYVFVCACMLSLECTAIAEHHVGPLNPAAPPSTASYLVQLVGSDSNLADPPVLLHLEKRGCRSCLPV